MKEVLKDRIINYDKNFYDNKFLIRKLNYEDKIKDNDFTIIFLKDLLEDFKNQEMLNKSKTKPATWSNVYSPKDELRIFTKIFQEAIENNKKIHIIGITLGEEIDILERYYRNLGFFSDEINAFKVDFSKVLVSVSIYPENIMWKGSDYKRMGKEIFFNPPIRESGQVKKLFKGINRGVIAGIYYDSKRDNSEYNNFFQKELLQEHILPITLAKVLNYNLSDFGFNGVFDEIIISY